MLGFVNDDGDIPPLDAELWKEYRASLF